MNNPLKTFVLRVALFFSPILIFAIWYLIADPFSVIYNYGNDAYANKPTFVKNREWITMAALEQSKDRYHYDTFIFGNSRSIFWEIKDLKEYLPDKNPFHFDASSEDLYGVKEKLTYLCDNNYNIQNAIILLDRRVITRETQRIAPLFNRAPALVKNKPVLLSHMEMFSSIVSHPQLIIAYCDYTIFGKKRDYIKSLLETEENYCYNVEGNQLSLTYFENLISKNPNSFYNEEKMSQFYYRDTTTVTYTDILIKEEQYSILKDIKNILADNDIKYTIVLNPLYDMLAINPKDKQILTEIFGEDKLHDFSGNNFITRDYFNYYENGHYRPHAAKMIMESIFSNKQNFFE